VPIDLVRAPAHAHHETAVRPSGVVTPAQAEANLRKDSKAAEEASAAPQEGETTPAEHALNQAMANVSDEGTNLLANGATETPAPAN